MFGYSSYFSLYPCPTFPTLGQLPIISVAHPIKKILPDLNIGLLFCLKEISELCERMLAYKIGTYEELDGEMEGCRLNIALLGLNGSGKSALINNIFESLGIESEPAITQSTGKESMMTLDGYAVPGTQITLYDPRGFFELDRTEQGNSNYLRISIKKFLIDIMP